MILQQKALLRELVVLTVGVRLRVKRTTDKPRQLSHCLHGTGVKDVKKVR
jgi:hypothetical protein